MSADEDSCSTVLDWDCSEFLNGEDAVAISIPFDNLFENDVFYSFVETTENYVSLVYWQNKKDFTDLRALADRDLQEHVGCFSYYTGDVTLYSTYFGLDEDDAEMYDCNDFL